MVEITITASARTLLRQAECAHGLGSCRVWTQPAMKLALTAEAVLQIRQRSKRNPSLILLARFAGLAHPNDRHSNRHVQARRLGRTIVRARNAQRHSAGRGSIGTRSPQDNHSGHRG